MTAAAVTTAAAAMAAGGAAMGIPAARRGERRPARCSVWRRMVCRCVRAGRL